METPTQTKIDSRDLKDVKRADLNPMELTSFFFFPITVARRRRKKKINLPLSSEDDERLPWLQLTGPRFSKLEARHDGKYRQQIRESFVSP